MKPVHSKPFDIDSAKNGAPFSQSNGDEAQIFIWDLFGPFPIAGKARGWDNNWSVVAWSSDGRVDTARMGEAVSLIMTPLGMIDGKPVFCGDEFLLPVSNELRKASPDMAGGDWSKCAWPVPAPKWPETAMSGSELVATWNGTPGYDDEFKAVANAAIAHACESGAVVTAEAADKIRKEAYADGQASAFKHEETARSDRDMAIAEAIRSKCWQLSDIGDGALLITKYDISTVIATVK